MESNNLFRFRWQGTLWKCVVLAVALSMLPDAASLMAGIGLAWVLFGGTLSTIFDPGIARTHLLPYRVEHVIAAESKYRLLAALPLLLPIVVATCVLGIRAGLTPLQCIDLAFRLFSLALGTAFAGIVVILFGAAENRWLQWRLLLVVPLFVVAITITVAAAIFSMAEFGWAAWGGCAVAFAALAACYRLSLYWYYHCRVDLVTKPTV